MCVEVLKDITTCSRHLFKLQFPVSILFKVVYQSIQKRYQNTVITNRNQKKINSMHIITTVP